MKTQKFYEEYQRLSHAQKDYVYEKVEFLNELNRYLKTAPPSEKSVSAPRDISAKVREYREKHNLPE
jgi:hypothetical protein